jgi:hypothetical protein
MTLLKNITDSLSLDPSATFLVEGKVKTSHTSLSDWEHHARALGFYPYYSHGRYWAAPNKDEAREGGVVKGVFARDHGDVDTGVGYLDHDYKRDELDDKPLTLSGSRDEYERRGREAAVRDKKGGVTEGKKDDARLGPFVAFNKKIYELSKNKNPERAFSKAFATEKDVETWIKKRKDSTDWSIFPYWYKLQLLTSHS